MLFDTETILATIETIWPYWPVLFPAALTSIVFPRGRVHKLTRLVWSLLLLWHFWAVLWFGLVFSGRIQSGGLSEIGFWTAGILLAALAVLEALKERQRMQEPVDPDLQALRSLSPNDFENRVADVYRSYHRRVVPSDNRGKHDPDLYLYPRNGQKWIVKCLPKTRTVSLRHIKGFYRTMQKMRVPRGAVITTGQFSGSALRWAADKPLHLYNAEDLLYAIRKVEAHKK